LKTEYKKLESFTFFFTHFWSCKPSKITWFELFISYFNLHFWQKNFRKKNAGQNTLLLCSLVNQGFGHKCDRKICHHIISSVKEIFINQLTGSNQRLFVLPNFVAILKEYKEKENILL
jgi:hypothetical protein